MVAKKDETVVAVKGFDSKMQCRGYQFEVGQTYVHEGVVKACEGGFHSCEYPLDVFGYYDPATSIYATVEATGKIDRRGEDSKIASASLRIKAVIQIPDMVAMAIKWITDKCDPVKAAHSKGNLSASSATGDRSASSATGKNAVAMNIGVAGKAKAGKDGAIVLCNHDADYNIRHIRASKVGENGIEADKYYVLDDEGNFKEAA